MLGSAKVVSRAGAREMLALENHGAKIDFIYSEHKIIILHLGLSPEYLDRSGVATGLLARLGFGSTGDNTQYKAGCENDEAIFDIGNGKVSKVSIQANFLE